MTLIKTSLLSAIAVTIKMTALLVINKILAIYVGPSGYAALGQFQNAVQICTKLGSCGINAGVTKYTAEHHEDEEKQHLLWRTAGTIALVGSVLTASTVAYFSDLLSLYFLHSIEFEEVFIWFSITVIFFIFNSLFLSILNGKKEVARYVIANIFGSLFSLIVTSVLSIYMGLYGALISLAIYQSLTFFVTLFVIYSADWFKFSYIYGDFDTSIALKLGGYSLMALTSAVSVPLTQILIRDHITDTFGADSAGYWEAMWRLSGAYLMIVTTTLSVYYLPRLSELTGFDNLKSEIIQGYKVILPVAFFCSACIYFLRHEIILILFSDSFSPMENLFIFQLLGDVLKIGGWILAYLMLGKAMTKLYIFSELSFSVSFYSLTVILTDYVGLQGVTIAYSINYLIYWLVMGYALRSYLIRLDCKNGQKQEISCI